MTTTNERDISYILKALPHRYPFLLVDRVLDYAADARLTAVKNVTVNEPHFTGHFPDYPVMPGVLQLEALAQASGLLLMLSAGMETLPPGYYFFLAGMDECRFRRPVTPGDQLLLEVECTRKSRSLSRFRGVATVDGKVASEATLTIVYKKSADVGGAGD